jgi:hypothetical protein
MAESISKMSFDKLISSTAPTGDAATGKLSLQYSGFA